MVKRSQKSKVEGRKSKLLQLIVCLLTFNCGLATALPGQQPQAQRGQPLYAANAKYVNGVAPGYWPTAGTGLTLNLTAGTALCGNPLAPVTYAGGTLTMTAAATNFVYLDPCAPACRRRTLQASTSGRFQSRRW